MIFEFYPSTSKELLVDPIKFAKQRITISKEDHTIIQHTRKSLLYNQENPYQKKNT